ncbi:DUF177 domain-containing protein [Stecheria sp. CLA-KB-P133]|uniref:DUF177 domain-containing protein n=1 Tax=Grylomicrobium aquisgranensis TaxID=2926318 RepID=A0AB35U7J0_9FIRM|nr:YceD family protein [Lactimicrobium massiliense]MDX8419159.1 DUF177 domain-containing protein [Stecheria sp. CLA-KB-P133]MDY3930306.1 YceD family protein [Erysipelotrichaceae bacterium]MDD6230840.1 YceD family protein [Lactimicrobium massiliense]MDD6457486.1 YceD family protein [Lactimicrobium massiliense]MDD6560127.1 YceD family protein [Lactimicrobium massiliense]
MKWTREELERNDSPVSFDEDVEIDDSAFAENKLINAVRNVHIGGTGWLDDETGLFECDIHLTGEMLLPDAITGAQIAVPLETDSHEVYSFEETDEEDVRVVTDEVIDLLPAVIDAIMLEVPISVTEVEEDAYPSGDGWRVISEAEYQESRKNRIDPRLAKLKEFKSE